MEFISALCQEGLKEDEYERVMSIIKEFKRQPGAVIPILHEVQKVFGYLPPAVQDLIATELGMPVVDVNGIVSFYTLFREKPKGQYVIGVCKGTACYVKGTERILSKLKSVLGIEPGDTTKDGVFSLEVLRCLGSCGLGPVIMINDKVYTRVKAEKIEEILASYYPADKKQ
ncbi:MAG: NADH-quinone oxidoreductase subunit NuoE [Peptococcaceae bacterium]|jgi:NADH:ubiquinone oxidoreductase subunit E|nr:NADH-quinone oxidoreductase subunit NuoE [Peptococcaceae bacterium]MDH7525947.1 NADH-quinone oxidoreductase subunit NuoE [Peptococcaceae bacterium]